MKIKRAISVILAASAVVLCFAGCTADLPETPAETYTASYTYVNPIKPDIPTSAPAEGEEGDTMQTAIANSGAVVKSTNVDFVLKDYYIFGSSVAKITNVELDDYGIGNINGYADVEIISVGHRSDGMRIGYRAYDATGKLVRQSFILAKLDDKSIADGTVVEARRFDFPREAVKVEFYDYVEE